MKDLCPRCGARRVDRQIGLESDPRAYVATMVEVFAEVWRVLRDDGTLWLNLGDSYSGYHGNKNHVVPTSSTNGWTQGYNENLRGDRRPQDIGLKPKDLVGIPWRVALALQEWGWYLRSDIIWAKPNPMPESVEDRPTKAHEYLFLLSKRPDYFYDADAIREPVSPKSTFDRPGPTAPTPSGRADGVNDKRIAARLGHGSAGSASGRNRRTVWEVATTPWPGAHFATFPPKLVEPCILAGTSARGCCPACGAGWVRETEVEYVKSPVHGNGSVVGRHYKTGANNFDGSGMPRLNKQVSTLGWRPACRCDSGPPVPCVVFDPFVGSGTVPLVANALGRHGLGVDLNQEYLSMAKRRIDRPHARQPRPEQAGDDMGGQGSLFA